MCVYDDVDDTGTVQRDDNFGHENICTGSHPKVETSKNSGDHYSVERFFLETIPSLRTEQKIQVLEVVQEPGDTVYVPAGWAHCVLNLERGCAIAESVLLPAGGCVVAPELWEKLCTKQPAFACVLRECLEEAGVVDRGQLPFVSNDGIPEADRVLQGSGADEDVVLLVSGRFLQDWKETKPSIGECRKIQSVEKLMRSHEELLALVAKCEDQVRPR